MIFFDIVRIGQQYIILQNSKNQKRKGLSISDDEESCCKITMYSSSKTSKKGIIISPSILEILLGDIEGQLLLVAPFIPGKSSYLLIRRLQVDDPISTFRNVPLILLKTPVYQLARRLKQVPSIVDIEHDPIGARLPAQRRERAGPLQKLLKNPGALEVATEVALEACA